MAKKTLPDLTVRAHDLHDAVFKLAALNQAWQNPSNTVAQSRALFDRMQEQLREVRGQATRYGRGLAAHKRAG